MGIWGHKVVGGGSYVVTKERSAPWWVWVIGALFLLGLFGGK